MNNLGKQKALTYELQSKKDWLIQLISIKNKKELPQKKNELTPPPN